MFLYLSRLTASAIILLILGLAVAGTYAGVAGIFIFLGFSLTSSVIGVPVALICLALTAQIAFATLWGSIKSIWNNLTYWGQELDSFSVKLIWNKLYFIDKSESEIESLNEELQKYKIELSNISAQFQAIYSKDIRPITLLPLKKISHIQLNYTLSMREVIEKCENLAIKIDKISHCISFLLKQKLPSIESMLKLYNTTTNLHEEKKQHLLNCVNKFNTRFLNLFTDILVLSGQIDKTLKNLYKLNNLTSPPPLTLTSLKQNRENSQLPQQRADSASTPIPP